MAKTDGKVTEMPGAQTNQADDTNDNDLPFDYALGCETVILNEDDQTIIDEIMDAAKVKAAPIRERMKSRIKAAREKGCSGDVLALVANERKQIRRMSKARDNLSELHAGQATQLTFDLEQSQTEAA